MRLLAVLVLAAAGSAHAQRVEPHRFAPSPEALAEAPRRLALFPTHPDDYRWEGALVGGIGFGVASAFVGYTFCCSSSGELESQKNVLGGLLGLVVGGAVGGVIGALFGGMLPKEHEE